MGKLWAVVVICACLAVAAPAQNLEKNTSEQERSERACAPGLEHFYNLEYDEAIYSFQRLIESEPENPGAWNHLSQALFYGAMFDAGMMSSDLLASNDSVTKSKKLTITPERNQELKAALAKAVGLSEARLTVNANDTFAIYQLGVALALRANYDFLVRHDWIGGFRDANQSRKLHERILKLQPSDYDARLIPGTHEYIIGTLPMMVRFAARAAGLSVNREQGLRTIEMVSDHGQTARTDAKILVSVLYRREHRSAEAIPIIRELSEQYPRNFLLHIELAKLYRDIGQRQKEAGELQNLDLLISRNAPGYDNSRVAVIQQQRSILLPESASFAEAKSFLP